jgi:NAD(P)-dependent dehydrogenase (short-subunit alcohol dehydrogenase family)
MKRVKRRTVMSKRIVESAPLKALPVQRRPVALVTGGGRGIGLGIAECLAKDGYNIAVCGVREKESVTEALKGLQSLGAEVLYCRADVADAAARKRMLGAIRKRFGRLDVLVNNAGVAPTVRADILEATEDSFERLIRINLQGPYFLTQAVARWMIAQKQADPSFAGCIINVSSVSATVASVNRGDYCISKAGVSMATKLWAARLGEYDIPVYEIRPGIIKSDMTAGVTAKYDKLIGEGLFIQRRWGLPGDVGRAAAMMARGDIAYSTGQVLMVDGGHSVQRL